MAIREPETFQRDGVVVRVCPRTPRTQMIFLSIYTKLLESDKAIADEYDVNVDTINVAMYEYAMMCSRANIEGEIDFVLASSRMDNGEIEQSFKRYMETDYMGVVDRLLDAVRKQDKPVSDVTAPTPPDDSKKK